MLDREREDLRKERIVKNEQAFRDYNDRRAGFEQRAGEPDDWTEDVPWVCECGNSECIAALEATVDEFTSAHSAPNRFFVVPGHVYPDVERPVAKHADFWVIEKYV